MTSKDYTLFCENWSKANRYFERKDYVAASMFYLLTNQKIKYFHDTCPEYFQQNQTYFLKVWKEAADMYKTCDSIVRCPQIPTNIVDLPDVPTHKIGKPKGRGRGRGRK